MHASSLVTIAISSNAFMSLRSNIGILKALLFFKGNYYLDKYLKIFVIPNFSNLQIIQTQHDHECGNESNN